MGTGLSIIHGRDFGTLRIEREVIEVSSMMATKPDPAWHYTDNAGHIHRWDNGYPTLTEVIDREWWCEDCREQHTDYRQVCLACWESGLDVEIMPRYVSDPGPHYIPGPTSYYLNDERITAEEYGRLIAEAIR